MIRKILLWAIASAAVLWVADWIVLRVRAERFAEIEVRHRYALQLRGKQVEQLSGPPQTEECVRSIFPHYDESPCWYIRRYANSTESLDGRPWRFWKE